MPDGVDTTRDAVAAAFKEVQARESAPAPEPAAESAPEPSAPAREADTAEPAKEPTPNRDGKGRFIVPPKQKPAATEKAPASVVSTGQGGAVSVPPPGQGAAPPAPRPTLEALKPPQDWRLSAREKWASLPREVQEEALRLHVETKKTLSEMAEVRKGYDGYSKATAPYEQMIRAEGLEPTQAIGLLLQREAALRTAPMQMRAKIIAHGIKTFLGTDDAAIDLLARELQGTPGQAQGAPAQIDPRQLIAQAKQEFAREFETRRNEMVGQSAQGEMEAFAQAHEFMDDVDPETGLTVAEDMANLMEAGVRQGKNMSFDDAWKRATKRHSEVSKVIGQREAAKAATAKAATTQAARAASSSIRSEPAGPSANGRATQDVREVVSQAYYAQKNAR